jgi:predicted branched-subunit amino acid permease
MSRQDPARRAEFVRGARDIAPTTPGMLVWGLVTGVAMVKSGLPIPWALLLTFAAYAGTAQLATLPLLVTAVPVWIVVVTALLTNLRFVIYSAALRGSFAAYRPRRRMLLGYLTGDFTFVAYMNRLEREGPFAHRDAYFLGMSAYNWSVWQVASVAGIVGAAIVPTSWGLEFAGTLALLALLVPMCRQRPALAGAIVAAAIAVLGHAWSYKLGLLAGVLAGIAVAMWVDTRTA